MIGTREKRNFVLLYNTYNSFLSLCISVIGTAAVKWSPPFRKKEKNKIIRERENSLLQSTTFSKASLYTQIPSIVGRSQTIQGPIKGHVSIYRKADRQLFVSIAQIWQDTTATHSRQSWAHWTRGNQISSRPKTNFFQLFFLYCRSQLGVCMYVRGKSHSNVVVVLVSRKTS